MWRRGAESGSRGLVRVMEPNRYRSIIIDTATVRLGWWMAQANNQTERPCLAIYPGSLQYSTTSGGVLWSFLPSGVMAWSPPFWYLSLVLCCNIAIGANWPHHISFLRSLVVPTVVTHVPTSINCLLAITVLIQYCTNGPYVEEIWQVRLSTTDSMGLL
jgi:hypothetical protein